jgi:hypothetical protein
MRAKMKYICKKFINHQIKKQCDSVTRYFARQLLNKHAKNYQNVEKITKFLLSTKVVWKSIKHLSKTKSVKCFPSSKLCCFHVFLSHLYFLIAIVQNANMMLRWSSLGPGSLARNQHRVSGYQQDSVDSARQLGPAACNLDVQFCRHGPATVLNEFLKNRLCHYGVFCLISCDNQNITNFKISY